MRQPTTIQLLAIRDLLVLKFRMTETQVHQTVTDAIERGRTPWGDLPGHRNDRHIELYRMLKRHAP